MKEPDADNREFWIERETTLASVHVGQWTTEVEPITLQPGVYRLILNFGTGQIVGIEDERGKLITRAL